MNKRRFSTASIAMNNMKFANPCDLAKCKISANITSVQNHHCLNTLFLADSYSFPSGFIKLTANTGLKIKATISEAASVNIKIVGRYIMNFPMIPFQNNNGKNGARVVAVPASTGTKTSPAASFALLTIGIAPLLYILCVFSITTIASSTIMPRPKSRPNNTIKFSVTLVPTMPSAMGKNRNATNTLSGTLSATKNALVTPIKNISTSSTKTNPITIVFTRSLKDVAVALL